MLTQITIDIFSILAILFKSKCVFFSTKYILSNKRVQLKLNTIETLKYIKY